MPAQEENMFRRTDCHFAVGPEQYDQARAPGTVSGRASPRPWWMRRWIMDVHHCHHSSNCCRPPAASTAGTDGWVCAHRGQEADQYLPEKTALINAEGGTVHLAAGP